MCDLEISRIGAPYVNIYDLRRVNDFTLILLTWRKWSTPNNASKWQMGFNSAFKGLNSSTKIVKYTYYFKCLQDWQHTYNVSLGHIHATTVALEEQLVVHILSVCL
jgi:hypothetical protein